MTGNASEIQAAINQATVKGAMGATATQQVEGDDRGFGEMLAEYCQMRDVYLNNAYVTDDAEIEALLAMQTKIEDIVDFWYENYAGPNSSQQTPDWYAGWPITSLNELYEDYNNWANRRIEIINSPFYQGQTQTHGPIENMFVSLDKDHHALNPHFVYDMMEPGIGRVNYFRGKVQEYQNVINQMNDTDVILSIT